MTMPSHPLLRRLVESNDARLIDAASLDDWLACAGEHVLFFAGDPVRFPEALDVAVVLPELRAAFGHRFDVALVAENDESALARRFGAERRPALVFLREGGYLATVNGMRDWRDYLDDIAAALDSPVSRVPGIGIPVVAAGSSSAAACR